MPLVRIDVLDHHSDATLVALADAVHQALTETIDVPKDDRFQILTRHAAGLLIADPQYLGIARDENRVFISITLKTGRTVEKKRALYRRITELAAAEAGFEARNILITLTENDLADWSFGNGEAQLLP
ncbi:tautomerase family protein [Kitasatospora sp. NPDC004531]